MLDERISQLQESPNLHEIHLKLEKLENILSSRKVTRRGEIVNLVTRRDGLYNKLYKKYTGVLEQLVKSKSIKKKQRKATKTRLKSKSRIMTRKRMSI